MRTQGGYWTTRVMDESRGAWRRKATLLKKRQQVLVEALDANG